MKTFFRGFSVFSLVLILVAAMAFPVFAQSGDGTTTTFPSDLTTLLKWLTGSGGAVILLAWAASWYLEGLAWWAAITSKNRSVIILAGSLILGIFSVWLQTNPVLVALLDPYFKAAMAIILVWLTTQTAHKTDSAAK